MGKKKPAFRWPWVAERRRKECMSEENGEEWWRRHKRTVSLGYLSILSHRFFLHPLYDIYCIFNFRIRENPNFANQCNSKLKREGGDVSASSIGEIKFKQSPL